MAGLHARSIGDSVKRYVTTTYQIRNEAASASKKLPRLYYDQMNRLASRDT